MSLLTIEADEYNRFYLSLQFILRPDIEGGYINDPSDAGGETKWGISKKAYPNDDIKNLVPQRACEIYYRDYWQRSGCPAIGYPNCVLVFDASVNLGVNAALRLWDECDGDTKRFLQLRKDYYVVLVKKKPTNQKYLAGWLNRVQKLEKYIATSQA